MLLVTEMDADALRRHYNTLVSHVELKDASVEQATFYLLPDFKAIPGEHGRGPRFMSVSCSIRKMSEPDRPT